MNLLLKMFLAVVVGANFLWATQAASAEGTAADAVKTDQALFAAGCFWKTQYVMDKVPGVVSTRVGYCGGNTADPNYKKVCTDTTGYAETVEVNYDPKKTSYHKLLETFFANHNPTTMNRQGVDAGTQYRSVIFYETPDQKKEAQAYTAELTKSKRFDSPIVTQIVPATKFYPGEYYHQKYFLKHGQTCN